MINRNKKGVANRIAVTFLSFSTALFLSGASLAVPLVANAALTESQIQSILSLLQSFGADAATVNNVNSSLRGQPTTPVPPSSTGNCGFTRSLKQGLTGADVRCLQQYLNSTAFKVAASGAGSPGGETTYFGPATKSAIAKWQAANGVAPAAGLFGPLSQAKYNSLVASGPTPTPGPTPIPGVGTGLQVMPGTQPANYIAPGGAARVPFTVIKLTAANDGDVTVNGVTVERTGPAADGAFVGVVLLDENGVQMGISKTLNSTHQAVVGGAFVVKAGQTRTLTVAANMDTLTNLADDAGNIAMFSVNGINTSATVSGSLPITGAANTINGALTIGSVTMARGSLDPGAAQTKEVGTLAYTFSSVKVTAGSAEKVWLSHIIWNQIGSAGSSDLANVKTYVDGTAYDTVVSSDGKYYTAKFPGNGILIDKGFSVDISIKGDILGGSSRTIAFDIAKRTDIGLMGDNFKFGITPPQTGSSAAPQVAAFTSGEDPWYDGATVTVSTGTMNVSVATAVNAQNIGINLANQPLGALSVDVKGEAISVGRIGFNVTLGSNDTDDIDDITNAILVDETGAIVAGPVDGTAADSANTTGSGEGSIVFTDSVTFSTGMHTYTLKGKIGTDMNNNTTITASTTPSVDWATVRGLTTGNTITPAPASALTLPAMTVKSGALTVSTQTTPIAQTVIAGASQFEFARYAFDAIASGEDVRVTAVPLAYNAVTGSATDVTNCKLYDGATVVNSSNIVNPSSVSSSTNFTFDGSGLILTKGTSKTLNLKCDLRSGSTGKYQWGLGGDDADNAAHSNDWTGVSGVTSGQTIAQTVSDSAGQIMTAASGGSLAVILDSSSPAYKPANSGMTNVELTRIRFDASNEDIDLRQVALQLSGTGSNTPNDLLNRSVTLWTTDGVQIGSAQFSVTQGDFATSSAIASNAFRIPKDGNKVLVVKGDLATICNSCDIISSGDFVKVDYDGENTGINGNYGVGVSSGGNVTPTGADTASEGVRLFKAYPSFAAVSGWQPSSLANGDQPLMRFSVKANAGNVGVYKFTIRMATTTAIVSSINVFGYTDSAFSSPVTGVNTGAGQLNGTNGVWVDASTDINFVVQDSSATSKVLTIPSGSTYYFEVRGTVAGSVSGASVSTQLQGDATSFSAASAQMDQAATVDGFVDDDFIWTPHSTTTAGIANNDFSNGYLLSGLPTSNMNAQVLSK
ncbi:hypothetical protein A3I27_03875 [Candidatus Giovannonibacteria bacterium RIFCSPLOWO2_02_FULL_43_11b]|uniref:Peptidoglycan binding-like domain-containing protein n=1 Tax=Candidatus Giovannonibacteria bacterium RIFCSPHIGHO2_12_FULL_43_15 TaxID=1798341 RepID=A0A1F5WNN5_9BACT|nr:MAG: hypothetical protein A2739_00555 [Candidatus Giovannonibacteria bacterium RIFCSPHIGHO2_01_FULL_43_100]OGF66152.1 MAG: hypothetical protein A3B97_03145 [Candidatus Giovannonibacteria bacterium RIFCSPHIGHO2_02_FULL_43_32]OGF77268.1 MAG: hypothetical protein A3F23_02100 [Candidatus Giovannonibacteria bacterium RIFCSPHIGHO2_12_FULL_43_15]OGF78171.1 MAG: hypothetical protein A3A15_00460 [Candidatus Giovannonibacteria bacterium RIFCSPLOWO2_01_FULL_43_60]OGF89119.1 MAG: hypothetical protein A3